LSWDNLGQFLYKGWFLGIIFNSDWWCKNFSLFLSIAFIFFGNFYLLMVSLMMLLVEGGSFAFFVFVVF